MGFCSTCRLANDVANSVLSLYSKYSKSAAQLGIYCSCAFCVYCRNQRFPRYGASTRSRPRSRPRPWSWSNVSEGIARPGSQIITQPRCELYSNVNYLRTNSMYRRYGRPVFLLPIKTNIRERLVSHKPTSSIWELTQ